MKQLLPYLLTLSLSSFGMSNFSKHESEQPTQNNFSEVGKSTEQLCSDIGGISIDGMDLLEKIKQASIDMGMRPKSTVQITTLLSSHIDTTSSYCLTSKETNPLDQLQHKTTIYETNRNNLRTLASLEIEEDPNKSYYLLTEKLSINGDTNLRTPFGYCNIMECEIQNRRLKL
jgi:hypothetical protein